MQPGHRLAIAFALLVCSLPAVAVRYTLDNVSNQVITCDTKNPLLQSLPTASCIAHPPNTLLLQATADPGEDASVVDEVYVVAQYQGGWYVYMRPSSPQHDWLPLSRRALADLAAQPPSFTRFSAWETATLARTISFPPEIALEQVQLFAASRSPMTGQLWPTSIKQIL